MRNEKGQFIKGHSIPKEWEVYNKLKANKTSFKSGRISFNKGKKLSDIHKTNISESQKGDKGHWFGKKWDLETRLKWSKTKPCKEKHWNWKGGVSESHKRTNNIGWNEIRKQVYKRDGYTCQVCSKKNPRPLQCHHIIPYRITQDDSMENLITLCCHCHTTEEHKYYRRIKNVDK